MPGSETTRVVLPQMPEPSCTDRELDAADAKSLRILLAQFTVQPRFGEFPVAENSVGRNVQRFRRLLFSEPPEVSQFDNLTHARVGGGESRQSVIQGDQVVGSI